MTGSYNRSAEVAAGDAGSAAPSAAMAAFAAFAESVEGLESFMISTESPGDVIVGLAIRRRGEYLAGRADFNQFAQVHEPGDVGHAGGLLQIVRDDHDAIFLAQRLQGFLDAQGRNR